MVPVRMWLPESCPNPALVLYLALVASALLYPEAEAGPGGFGKDSSACGLPCYSWNKCKQTLNKLSSGQKRPGQAGTTGQLFFNKCGSPPEGCECKPEEPPPTTTPDPRPKISKTTLEFVNEDALKWMENFLEVVT